MVLTKKCTKCGGEKPLSNFYARSSAKDGLQSRCKKCCAESSRKWYQDNTEKVKEQHRDYNLKNREKRKKYLEKYIAENKDKIRERAHKKYWENVTLSRRKNRENALRYKDHRREYNKKYYEENKKAILEKQKKYEEKQREKRREYSKKYYYEHREEVNGKRLARLHNDSVSARKERLRTAVRDVIRTVRRNGVPQKNSLAKEITGKEPYELWVFLKKTWEKEYGAQWNGEPFHIDHVTPLCVAKTADEVEKLFYYTNLRMLTPEDNFKKRTEDLKLAKRLQDGESLSSFST